MHLRDVRRLGRLAAMLCVVTVMAMLIAIPAFAAPADPYLGLNDLQQMLDDAGGSPVTGYLKTVLRGSTIETIPVDVIALTSDDMGASNATRALIVFEAYGPKIDKIGGIASGMSGSPIYVDDGGTDKVIGALSYGDYFSKNGVGLATPIEAMLAVAGYPSNPSLTVTSLQAPVVTSAGTLNRVVLTTDSKIAKASRGSMTLVAKPYNALAIGALPPNSPGYKKLAEKSKSLGFEVLPNSTALGMGKNDWSVPFEPGSSAAAMLCWGDFWAGGIGTATYVDSETVLAFGHPMDWSGTSEFAFANAWVDYVWPSTYSPWKLARPGMVRGSVVQDRGAAILGRTDIRSTVTTVTSRVDEAGTGLDISGTAYMPRTILSGDWPDLPGYAIYSTALRAADDYYYDGTAVTTTTVVVSDGINEYTVVRPNIVYSSWDAAWVMLEDPWNMVWQFRGIEDAEVLSVDFEASLSPDRQTARIRDVVAPNGLKAGQDNPVTVSLSEYGNPTTQTIDVTITIPAGVPNTGRLTVYGGSGYYFDEEYDEDASSETSIAAAQLANQPKNSDLVVRFWPYDFMSRKSYKAVETTAATPWFLEGYKSKQTAFFDLEVYPSTSDYNTYCMLMGSVEDVYREATLEVYKRSVDSTVSSLVGTTTIDGSGYDEFEMDVVGLKKNTVLTVRHPGDRNTLLTEASVTAKVRAAIKLTSNAYRVRTGKKVLLTATVAPSATTGTVVFQRYRYGAWRTIATKSLSGGKARTYFTPASGTNKVRVKYLGGTVNAAKTSTTKSIVAR